jgi:hypothetical protein
MRTAKFNEWGRPLGLTLLVAGCLFCNSSSSWAATNSTVARLQPGVQKIPPSIDVSRLRFSAGVGDIVKMVKADVGDEVIKAFIAVSRISYNPSAQEVIALKRLGVSNDLIQAMLLHRPRPTDGPQPSLPARLRTGPPPAEETPPEPGFPWSSYAMRYPVYPSAYSTMTPPIAPYFAVFGPLVSFNNSFPTYVNGQPVYTGYHIPIYAVLW